MLDNCKIKICFLNCRGQTGFTEAKQLQIENFLKIHDIDILNLQETHLEKDSFSSCNFILFNYEIIKNNSNSQYGTCILIKKNFEFQNVILHESGRVIILDIGTFTIGNVYLPSGTDNESRSKRESFCGEILPTLLVNAKECGILGGDWNNIVDKQDCTHHAESKLSPCLKRTVAAFNWTDSFRRLYPDKVCFSRYYNAANFIRI